MTVVVATAAPDGLVLASDGRTTLRNGRRHRIASDHTRKVFAPFPRIGIATYGAALLSDQTIAGHMEKFAATNATLDGAPIEATCRELSRYFTDLLEEQATAVGREPPTGVLGFVVAGYDEDGVGRIYDVLLPTPENAADPVVPHQDLSTRQPGHMFRGQVQHARRLFEGYDVDALARSDVQLGDAVTHELERLRYRMNAPLSLQEAVDLAVFVVRLTIDMDRLSDGTFAEPEGVPVCGGAMQVLLINAKGSSWILQPRLRPGQAGVGEAG